MKAAAEARDDERCFGGGWVDVEVGEVGRREGGAVLEGEVWDLVCFDFWL